MNKHKKGHTIIEEPMTEELKDYFYESGNGDNQFVKNGFWKNPYNQKGKLEVRRIGGGN